MKRYLVIVEEAENNYSAYSPDVPGCVTTGKTIEETLDNMQEALQLHLEDEATLPDPTSVAAMYLAVPLPASQPA